MDMPSTIRSLSRPVGQNSWFFPLPGVIDSRLLCVQPFPGGPEMTPSTAVHSLSVLTTQLPGKYCCYPLYSQGN